MRSMEALRALGPGGEAPVEAKQRVLSGLLAVLEAVPGSTTEVRPVPGVAGAAAAPVTVSAKSLAFAAAIWLAGGVTGALLYGAFRPVSTRIVYIERKPATAQLSTSTASEAASSAQPSAQAGGALPNTAPVGTPSSSSSARSGRASELARERTLLDSARSAASRAEPNAVLALVEQHRLSFPKGRLSEEREALAIRALLALGQRDRARARADAFRADFPGSFLIPMLASAFAQP